MKVMIKLANIKDTIKFFFQRLLGLKKRKKEKHKNNSFEYSFSILFREVLN